MKPNEASVGDVVVCIDEKGPLINGEEYRIHDIDEHKNMFGILINKVVRYYYPRRFVHCATYAGTVSDKNILAPVEDMTMQELVGPPPNVDYFAINKEFSTR